MELEWPARKKNHRMLIAEVSSVECTVPLHLEFGEDVPGSRVLTEANEKLPGLTDQPTACKDQIAVNPYNELWNGSIKLNISETLNEWITNGLALSLTAKFGTVLVHVSSLECPLPADLYLGITITGVNLMTMANAVLPVVPNQDVACKDYIENNYTYNELWNEDNKLDTSETLGDWSSTGESLNLMVKFEPFQVQVSVTSAECPVPVNFVLAHTINGVQILIQANALLPVMPNQPQTCKDFMENNRGYNELWNGETKLESSETLGHWSPNGVSLHLTAKGRAFEQRID